MKNDLPDVALDTPFVFILGCGRSGTTMLRSMFDSHPDIAIPGESGFIWQRRNRYENRGGVDVRRFVSELTAHPRFKRWGLDRGLVQRELANPPTDGFADLIRRLYRVYADSRGKERFGDKTPAHVLRISQIAQLFPEARIIHLIRDGRNVAMSYVDIKEWGPSSVTEAALYWRRRVEHGRRDGGRLGENRYQEVTYEALVDDPESELRRLCAFVDLGFDESMLRYFERASEVLSLELHPHRHQGLYSPPTKGLRDWRTKMSDEDVARFEAVAGETLEEFGYGRRFDHISTASRIGASLEIGAVGLRRAEALARGASRKLDWRRRTATRRVKSSAEGK
ncbi:MAG: sulfotransferase family protein [Actinomycetota bacterium]